MKKKIKYIGYYDVDEYLNENRGYALSAKNKMDYIISCIERTGNQVEVVSPALTKNNSGFFNKRETKISKNSKLKVFSSRGSKYRLIRVFYILKSWLEIIKTLLMSKKDDELIIYHSMGLVYPILIASKLKKIKFTLEIEEIYQDIGRYNKNLCKNEYKVFKKASNYIFSTELLKQKFDIKDKKYVISHGVYLSNKYNSEKWNDGKIHLVYSGIIDKLKGGAQIAIKIAEQLNSKYHLHILGFGAVEDIENIKELIAISNEHSECEISYNGVLYGNEYNKFLNKCHIGLSTQNASGEYLKSSFPSKILTYLSNGLYVVTAKFESLEISKLSKLLIFYDSNNYQEVANKIENIKLDYTYEIKKTLEDLDNEFFYDLTKMLKLGGYNE